MSKDEQDRELARMVRDAKEAKTTEGESCTTNSSRPSAAPPPIGCPTARRSPDGLMSPTAS